ncbi:MAG: subtilase-type protease inhibitor [Pseudonocardia sp.]|nr:subtilase-type protease inhibitor [Pseudonocardia sp.]
MLRRRGLMTVVALLALVGLVAALLTYLVPLAFAGAPAAGTGHRLQVVVTGSATDDGIVDLDCGGNGNDDGGGGGGGGGDHPAPGPACERLEELAATGDGAAFEPVPSDAPCTMQYGGPETATIVGTWDGRPVDASFARSDGCEIARWEALRPVLPDVTS